MTEAKQSLLKRLAEDAEYLDALIPTIDHSSPIGVKSIQVIKKNVTEAAIAIRELARWSIKTRNCLEKQFLNGDMNSTNNEAILAGGYRVGEQIEILDDLLTKYQETK